MEWKTVNAQQKSLDLAEGCVANCVGVTQDDVITLTKKKKLCRDIRPIVLPVYE